MQNQNDAINNVRQLISGDFEQHIIETIKILEILNEKACQETLRRLVGKTQQDALQIFKKANYHTIGSKKMITIVVPLKTLGQTKKETSTSNIDLSRGMQNLQRLASIGFVSIEILKGENKHYSMNVENVVDFIDLINPYVDLKKDKNVTHSMTITSDKKTSTLYFSTIKYLLQILECIKTDLSRQIITKLLNVDKSDSDKNILLDIAIATGKSHEIGTFSKCLTKMNKLNIISSNKVGLIKERKLNVELLSNIKTLTRVLPKGVNFTEYTPKKRANK